MMDKYNNIKLGSTVIAPSYLHSFIRKELLDTLGGYIGIKIMSFSGWLSTFSSNQTCTKETVLFNYFHELQQIRDQIKTYSNIISSLSFLEELYNFITKCKQYDIDLHLLPEQNEAQKELKMMIIKLFPIKTIIDVEKDAFQKILDNVDVLDHIHLYMDTFLNYYESTCLNKLIDLGAHTIYSEETTPDISFYHSTNMRQEIESCAQYITNHALHADEITLSIANTSYLPFVKQIFKRYQIPHQILMETSSSSIAKQFVIFLKYYLYKNRDDLYSLLETDVYQLPHISQLCEYMRLFDLDINDSFHHIEASKISEDIISIQEYEHLKRLEEQANIAKQELIPLLQEWVSLDHIESLLTYIYNTLHNTNKNMMHTTSFKQIQSYLQNTLPYLFTNQDIELLIAMIENMKEVNQDIETGGVVINDLKHPILPRKYHFMLSLTQSDYPAFPKESAIFSQDYLDQLPYPTLSKRYDQYIEQLNKQLNKSTNLILSYPRGDFSGKGKEAALEIEMYAKKRSIKYPLLMHSCEINHQASLDPQIARGLYLENNQIRGSISSLERYAQCPYAYFIHYGLRIKEPIDKAFSNSKLGTLAHYILEDLVNRYGKDYTTTSEDEVKEIIHHKIEEVIAIYPNLADSFQLVKKRLFISIMNTLAILKDMEEHTPFKPLYTEYEFQEIFTMNDDIELILKGFIDRVDGYNDYFRIIDYKSSPKTIRESNVFTAKQLQLLTYAMIMQKQLNRKAAGVYYHSLKSENIATINGKMNRRAKMFEAYDNEDYNLWRKSAQRLTGWHMIEDLTQLDDDATHIATLTSNKDGLISSRKIYNMDGIEEALIEIYKQLVLQILRGNISITPDKDACTFCKYHDICRFHHNFYEREPYATPNDNFYIKGGPSDGDME